jgi:DNA-binding GntR family transcriptional regulator
MTVRQALDALSRRGLVDRGVGRGTFVRGHAVRIEGRVVAVDEGRVVVEVPEGSELHPGSRVVLEERS